MSYFLNLYTPETWTSFCERGATISGFRKRHRSLARERVREALGIAVSGACIAQSSPRSHTGRNRSRAGRRRHGGARTRRALGDWK